MERFAKNNPQHIYDVLEHTLVAMKNSDSDYLLRLAILLHDIGKPLCYVEDENGIGHFPNHCKKGADMAREILNRLKFNKRDIQVVTKIIEFHDLQIPEKENQLRQFIAKFDEIELEMLFKLKRSNTLGKSPACVNELKKLDKDYERIQEILKRRTCIKKNELKIRGKDLLDLGVKQEELGRALDTLYGEVLENNLKNHKDQLVSYVIKNILPASYED
jgi:tRNA nucleotidyltransferase (CCA-adding enzyme)